MVVALGAADGRPHPRAGDVSDPVGLIDGPVFLDLQASLVARLQEPVVGGGEHAVVGMLAGEGLDQVAGELEDREPVEGHVLEKGRDHPVAIG